VITIGLGLIAVAASEMFPFVGFGIVGCPVFAEMGNNIVFPCFFTFLNACPFTCSGVSGVDDSF